MVETGPLYHGSPKESFESILKNGFNLPNPKTIEDVGRHVYHGPSLSGRGTMDTTRPDDDMHTGFGRGMRYRKEAPLHFFGFGIYFTRYKTAALNRYAWSDYDTPPNKDSIKTQFFIKAVPEEVRILSIDKMWRWWTDRGYNYEELIAPHLSMVLDLHNSLRGVKNDWKTREYKMLKDIVNTARFEATVNMTNVLKDKYDLLEYPLKSGLDSAQLCCFKPELIVARHGV